MKRRTWVAWTVAVGLAWPVGAGAHAIGLSRGDYAWQGHVLSIRWTLSRQDGEALVLQADPDPRIEQRTDTPRLVPPRVTTRGGPCQGTQERVVPTPGDGLQIDWRFVCPPGQPPTVDLGAALEALPSGHRHLPQVQGLARPPAFRGQPQFDLPAAREPDLPPPATNLLARAWAFVRMGIEHILSGPDHLLFLVGLLVLGGSLRTLLGVATAFTVGHSLTLAIATLGLWSPSPRWIEPLIGLSIAWVGVENFWRRSARGRWRLALPFGLVHGFGIAGALTAVHTPRPDVPLALVSFNAGVELGQLATLAVVLPILAGLRHLAWLERRHLHWINGGLVVAGLCWCVGRLGAPS